MAEISEDDDDDLMDNGHAVEDVRSSTFGYGHGEEIQRHQNISEDTGETRSAQPKKRARGDEDDDDDLMEDGHAIKNVRFSTFGYGYGEEVQRDQPRSAVGSSVPGRWHS